MAILPIQFQPVTVPQTVGEIVGYIEGTNNVGDADVDAVGDRVGAAVGLDGQLAMPCLKAHKAFASTRCRLVG